ncbi:hypothetical protein [Duganella fentianensis]|uniref:hypothetical protein n=1 Tax=Duganella fentianensis TaxID=2692177 RepID=UPI0032B0F68C
MGTRLAIKPTALPARRGRWGLALLLVLVLFFAMFGGLLVALFGMPAAALVVVVVGGVVMFMLPLRHVVGLMVLTAFLVVGQLVYFARIEKAFWIPFLFGFLLLLRLPAELMHRRLEDTFQAPFRPHLNGWIIGCLVVYFAALIGSTLINLNPPFQVLLSAREYFFIWGLYAVLASGLINPSLLARVWHWLPWLLPLQLPLVLYQRFVVAARRTVVSLGSGSPWDAVVGAFGGDPNGGGASGSMGLFVVFAMTLVTVRWRKGELRFSHWALIMISGLGALLLAEVKFAVLMLPVVMAFAFRRELVLRPVAAAGMLIVVFGLTGAMFGLYKYQYSNSYVEQHFGGYSDLVLKGALDTSALGGARTEMSRAAAVTFWYTQQTNMVDALIGHGMGATRKGVTAVGEVAARYPFTVARSSLAVLLWECGLIGCCALMAALFAAYQLAYRLSSDSRLVPSEQRLLVVVSAGIMLTAAELPYNTDLLYSAHMQILLMLLLAQVACSAGKITALRIRGRAVG